MSAQQLITEHIDLWTSSIKARNTQGRGSSKKRELYGIKKLRELILELAVRGKLVPQYPNDEPASELLKRIAAEKEQQIKDKKIKKQKSPPIITDEKKPFELPEEWEWCSLSAICILENGDRSKNYPNKSVLVEEGIPFVNAGHLQGGRIDRNEMTYIPEDRFNLLKAGKFSDGDILFCLRGSLGKSAIVDGFEKGAIASSLVIVRLIGSLNHWYIHNYFDSPFSYRQIKQYDNGTAQPNLSAADLGKFLVPVPPSEEQRRIVAKVDELMAHCDQLEQQTESSLDAHQLLVDTLLSTLTDSRDAKELSDNWTRLADHFDTLITTDYAVEQLKQTILQLAIQGNLVPQDPNDEPASELLKRIAAEKKQLIKDKKIKNQKSILVITDEEKPFGIPEGWKWSRIGDIGIGSTGKTPSTKVSEYFDGNIPFIGPGQITPSGELLDSDKTLTEEGLEFSTEAVEGDLLMVCIGGSIGKSTVTAKRVAFNQQINSLRPIIVISSYVHKAVSTNVFFQSVRDHSTGSATPIINRSKWEELLVPTPPLAEQYRIVAKVDELMTICDQLKARLNDAQATQLHLADVMVHDSVG
ncbi:MAG: restriction endonuclease subunit S [Flavobacteriales bacterium]|nr:restriction endonuclease subunit S [Flavobacteriales bacterium]